jgi:hypothetical protein
MPGGASLGKKVGIRAIVLARFILYAVVKEFCQ